MLNLFILDLDIIVVVFVFWGGGCSTCSTDGKKNRKSGSLYGSTYVSPGFE